MKIISATAMEATIVITRGELSFLRNTINETMSALHGDKHFSTRTGKTVEGAEAIYGSIKAVCDEIESHR